MNIQELSDLLARFNDSSDPVVYFAKTVVLALLLFMLLRYLLLGSFFRMIKRISRDVNKLVRREYGVRAWCGWILFLMSLSVFELLVLKADLLLQYGSFMVWMVVCGVLFLLALGAHLFAVTAALVSVLKQRMEIESN